MIRIEGTYYFTIYESAQVLSVTPGRVSHFLADGRLQSVSKLGRRLLAVKEVREFASHRSRQPGPVPGSARTHPHRDGVSAR